MTSKKCAGCHKEKDLSLFVKGRTICKLCANARSRQYYKDNPESAKLSKERHRRWRERNSGDKNE